MLSPLYDPANYSMRNLILTCSQSRRVLPCNKLPDFPKLGANLPDITSQNDIAKLHIVQLWSHRLACKLEGAVNSRECLRMADDKKKISSRTSLPLARSLGSCYSRAPDYRPSAGGFQVIDEPEKRNAAISEKPPKGDTIGRHAN